MGPETERGRKRDREEVERETEGLTESRVGKSDWDETKTEMEGETDGMEEGQRCEEREIRGKL